MKKTFNIKGMHCSSCAKLVESELEDKVKKIQVDAVKGIAIVEFDERKISEKEICNIIVNLGYTCS